MTSHEDLKEKTYNSLISSYNSRSPKMKLIYTEIRYCTYRSNNTTHSYSVLKVYKQQKNHLGII
jgi:hypothetical protein